MPRRLIDDLIARIDAATSDAASNAARAESSGREADVARRRSQLLREFVTYFREHRTELPLRCAWCGRIRIGRRWAAPEDFLDGDLPVRIRERATHGICDDCFERENAAAAAARETARPARPRARRSSRR
jgi:hypothetical protein